MLEVLLSLVAAIGLKVAIVPLVQLYGYRRGRREAAQDVADAYNTAVKVVGTDWNTSWAVPEVELRNAAGLHGVIDSRGVLHTDYEQPTESNDSVADVIDLGKRLRGEQ